MTVGTSKTEAAETRRRGDDAHAPLRPRDRWIRRLLPLFVGAIARAPKFSLAPVARFASFVHRRIGGRDMRILRQNLERILELPHDTAEHRRLAFAVTRHQSASALETVRAIFRPGSVRFDGMERLRQLLRGAEEQGRGQIVITAHLGSWELVGHTSAVACQKPFHALAKPSRIAGVTSFLEEMRERMGAKVLWTGRKSILRDMLGALRRGETLGFVMDQKPEVGGGRDVSFFGIPTPFVVGPGALAARTGCPVIAVFCLRRGPFHFEVLCEELFPSGHEIKDEDRLTQAMADAIEAAVRSTPEQWAWTYRRWRFE
ncbi:MAG: lysophospholipid acyltransferase family protein [Acidobacteriota bacterium]